MVLQFLNINFARVSKRRFLCGALTDRDFIELTSLSYLGTWHATDVLGCDLELFTFQGSGHLHRDHRGKANVFVREVFGHSVELCVIYQNVYHEVTIGRQLQSFLGQGLNPLVLGGRLLICLYLGTGELKGV